MTAPRTGRFRGFLFAVALFLISCHQSPLERNAFKLGPNPDRLAAGSNFEVDVSEVPQSLEELLGLSELVIAGTVESVSPAHLTNRANLNSAVESDAVFVVERILKGGDRNAQRKLKRVLVSQLGGQYQGHLSSPIGYSLIAQGDRSILFLAHDKSATEPVISGLSRYLVVGVWSGNFRVEQSGRVRVSPNCSPGLKAYDWMPEVEFRRAITSR